MARANHQITNFLSGELSPFLNGRSDTDRFQNALKTCENFTIKPYGGAQRRPGSYFVAEVKDSAKKVRLIRFEFSRAQSYILEFGDQYMRFYTQNGRIESSGTPVELATPYTEAQLDDIQVAQSADVLYIVHNSHNPRKLARVSNTSWTLTDVSFTAPKWDATDGYPTAVTFHQQRLWFGGTTAKPQSIFASKTDAFENFTVGTGDDDALEYQIASYKVNRVQWMSSTEVLIIGTSGGEFKVSGGAAALTPSNVQVTRQTSYGGLNKQPRHVGYQTLFVDGTGTKIRSYEYTWSQDVYESEDLAFLAEHITTGGIKEMAYQAVPDGIVWAIRNDGVLLGMTYDKARGVIGWHRHTTDGEYESVASIPQSTTDEVWVAVKRTIGGATKRYIEYLSPNINVDCGLTYSGSATASISGLNHLEGKTVQVRGDDSVYPEQVISSGAITLPSTVSKADIGLKYISTLETLPVEAGNPAGTAQGRKKRWNEIWVRLHDSFNPKVNDIMPPVRSPSTGMGVPEPRTTGDVRIHDTGYDYSGSIKVTQDLPGPTHILSIFGTIAVSSG